MTTETQPNRHSVTREPEPGNGSAQETLLPSPSVKPPREGFFICLFDAEQSLSYFDVQLYDSSQEVATIEDSEWLSNKVVSLALQHQAISVAILHYLPNIEASLMPIDIPLRQRLQQALATVGLELSNYRLLGKSGSFAVNQYNELRRTTYYGSSINS